MNVLTSPTDLLDRLRAVTAALTAGERSAGVVLAELVASLEEQVTSGALAFAWDPVVTGSRGQVMDAVVTRERDRVVIEVDALVEEAGGVFAIDLDLLANPPATATMPTPPAVLTPPTVSTAPTDPHTTDPHLGTYPNEFHGATLTSTKAWLAARKVTGADCPACGQFAKVYTRKMNHGQAGSLIRMWRAGGPSGTGWVHLPSQVGSKSREEGKLKHWGLVEKQTDVLGADGRRGVWRLTPKGVDFVLGEGTVPQAIRLYAAEFLGTTGPQITILDAIAGQFNYEQLMAE